MTSPVSQVSQPTAAPQSQPAKQQSREASPAVTGKSTAPATAKDVVSISAAALAAFKEEATESPATTATEARSGDRQAQRLLAQHEAQKVK